MHKAALSQEEMNDLCPNMVDLLKKILNEGIFTKNKEACFFALAQVLNELVDEIDLSLEDKGAAISCIITGFVETNEESLAAYRQFVMTILDKKASTVH